MGAEAGATSVTPTQAAPPPAATSATPAAPVTPQTSPSSTTQTPPPASVSGQSPGTTPSQGEPATALSTESPADGSAGAKGAEAPKPVEIRLPEGFKETPAFAEFKQAAGEAGLTSEAAQKIFGTYLKAQTQQQESQLTDWKAQQAKWIEGLRTDKEFGGTAYDTNMATAKRAVEKFGTAELRDVLNKSWVGNHPAVIRFFHAVGKSMAEDTVAGTSAAGAGPPSPEDQLKVLYPTHFQKKD